MADVIVQNVVKHFGTTAAVRGVSLDIKDGEFVVLVGPSGCGKSTTLRMIAGLEEISAGEIFIGGVPMAAVAPKDRNVAMVFQNYALYPHMTVEKNMSFGLRLRHTPKDEIRRRVSEAAEILGIAELLQRRPRELSGGERQRVAMGRAIVRKPNVFLFDEPLSNLDAKLRVKMRTEIKRLHQTLGATTIYVTHDQVEAMTLADRMVVMNKGRIEQVGTPLQVYDSPSTAFVATFVGSPSMNLLPCSVVGSESGVAVKLHDEAFVLQIPAARAERYTPHKGKQMRLGLRPEDFCDAAHREAAGWPTVKVTIDVVEPLGVETTVFFTLCGEEVCARLDPGFRVAPRDQILLALNMDKMHLIDPSTNTIV
jgi:multiple sugar transport system ATP-binding protein